MKIKVKPLVYVKLVSGTLYIFPTSETFLYTRLILSNFMVNIFQNLFIFYVYLFYTHSTFLYTSRTFFTYTFNNMVHDNIFENL